MPFSRDDLSESPQHHMGSNPRSYRLSDAVASHGPTPEHYGIVPTINHFANCPYSLCLYTGSDGNQCLQSINCATTPEHFRSVHRIKDLSRSAVFRCEWKDCECEVARQNFIRHIRERHLEHSRVSPHVERTREADSEFLDIGRKVLESGVIWKRESVEEKEDAGGHSDSTHMERSESESVVVLPL